MISRAMGQTTNKRLRGVSSRNVIGCVLRLRPESTPESVGPSPADPERGLQSSNMADAVATTSAVRAANAWPLAVQHLSPKRVELFRP